MGRVCVVGSFMFDIIAMVERRPAVGETIVGRDLVRSPGGKGFNQAVAAARAGAETAMIGTLGKDDHGAAFLAALAADNIDASGVATRADLGTGVGLPVVDGAGDNAIVILPGANTATDEALVERHRRLIEAADVLLLQLEIPTVASVAAARVAKAAGRLVVLNPAPAATVDDFDGLVDVITPNEGELAALVPDRRDDDRAAALHSRLGASAVVVTLGPAGAVVVTDAGSPTHIAAPAVSAIDTVGAGDTLCGYLAAGLAAGDSLTAVVERAVRAASISVTRSGGAASAPRWSEV